MLPSQTRSAQGKPVVRRGRKARGLAHWRDSPAASSLTKLVTAVRHGGCPEMTRSNGVLERMRWMSALALSAFLALAMGVVLHTPGGLLNALGSGAGAAPTGAAPPRTLATPPASASSLVLDPRIAKLAAQHPRSVVQAIVQFKPGVSVDRARWTVTHAGGRVFGELHIINALAVKLSSADARRLAASSAVHSVSLNSVVKTEGLPQLTTSNLQSTYDQTMGVLPLWRFRLSGTGVGVAVIDTGIDGQLPDFQTTE